MSTTIPIKKKEDIKMIKEYFLAREEYRNYAMFVMGINTALRISDILSINWADVYNFKKGKYFTHLELIEQKTHKKNVVFLNEKVTDALELHRTKQVLPKPAMKVFSSRLDPYKPLSRNQAYLVIRQACEDNNIEGHISCHSLRKTFGYHAWKMNTPEALLMNIYNHSSIEITKCYLGIGQEDKDNVYSNIML